MKKDTEEGKIFMFEDKQLLAIADKGFEGRKGCDNCFFNEMEDCRTIREQWGIPRCALHPRPHGLIFIDITKRFNPL